MDLDKALPVLRNGVVALNRATYTGVKMSEMAELVKVRQALFDLAEEIQKRIEERAFLDAKVTPLGDDIKPPRKKK